MSAQPVDVLAVLDGMLPEALDPVLREPTRADFDALREARAAVAELIEADREFDAASEAWDAIPGPPDGCTDDRDYDGAEYRRLCAAIERRGAALARCGVTHG